jgi:hypothetical protein
MRVLDDCNKATKGPGREFSAIDHCVVALLTGLITAGEDQKQLALELAFRALVDDVYVNRAKAHFQWKDGKP